MKIAVVQFSFGTIISGVGYIMGSLIDAGYNVDFYNLDNTKNDIINNLKNNFNKFKIINGKYDIIFISCLSMDVSFVYDLSNEIKRKSKSIIVVGGIHPTIIKDRMLKECKDIDFICIGEGESFAVEFVEKIISENYKNIQNLGYRDGNNIYINPIREPQDLNKLPNFPYHLYPKDYVIDMNGFAYIKSMRGCIYKCSFCCNSIFLKLYPNKYLRKRPIDDIILEMKKIKNIYNPKLICFSDEMLLTDNSYTIELFNKISKDINHPFGFLARVEHINKDIIEIASDCGCKYISMGVECGDEAFRKTYLNRHMTNKQIFDAFKICKDYNIYTTSLNMIGYPFDNDDDELTVSTIALNNILDPGCVQIAIFHPFEGTPLYDYCIKNDLIDPIKMRRSISCFDDTVLRNKSLSKKREYINNRFPKKPLII